jgi:hypothetical protein
MKTIFKQWSGTRNVPGVQAPIQKFDGFTPSTGYKDKPVKLQTSSNLHAKLTIGGMYIVSRQWGAGCNSIRVKGSISNSKYTLNIIDPTRTVSKQILITGSRDAEY